MRQRDFARVLGAILVAACGAPPPTTPPARAEPPVVIPVALGYPVTDAGTPADAGVAHDDTAAPPDPFELVYDAVEGTDRPFVFVGAQWSRVDKGALPPGISFATTSGYEGIGTPPPRADLQRVIQAAIPPAEPTHVGQSQPMVGFVQDGVLRGGTARTLRRALAPIDTPEKAQLLLESGFGIALEWKDARGRCVGCDRRFVRTTTSGELQMVGTWTLVSIGACLRGAPIVAEVRAVFGVTADGMVTVVSRAAVPPRPGGQTTHDAPCVGRDTAGSGRVSGEGPGLGGYFARAAADEAISIGAFRRLARELAAAEAPARLVDAARAAAVDEARHARTMRRLAADHGAPVVRLPPRRLGVRDPMEWLVENAREGCARETFCAVVASVQARHAPTAALRAIYTQIAEDERAHAWLAWEIHAWALSRAPRGERRELRRALRTALRGLEADVSEVSASARAAGEPAAAARRAIVDGLRRLAA